MLRFYQFVMLVFFVSVVKPVCAEQFGLAGINYNNRSFVHPVFHLSGAAHYRFFTLSNPNRLVVDFFDTRLDQTLPQPEMGHPLFQNVRTGIRNGHDLRVVLELKSAADVNGSLVKTANSAELILDLNVKPSASTVIGATPSPTPIVSNVANTQPAISLKKAVQKEKQPLELKPVTVNTTVNTAPLKAKGRDVIIAIDAGHGGKDVGAQGGNGTEEKDVVFAIAKRLEGLVNNQPGLKAVMIRKGDYFVKLHDRVRLAEEAKADLFVSIHADALPDGALARGASVYTLSNKGASSAEARMLADSENASDLIGGSASILEKNDTLVSVLQDLSHNAARQASQNLGSKVLKHVGTVGPLHSKAVQKAGLAVLRSHTIPSILVETAFISTPEEEEHLNSRAYQDRMATALLGGIMSHFHQYAPANTLLAQMSKSGKAFRVASVKEIPQEQPETNSTPILQSKVSTGIMPVANKSQHIINRGETLSGIAQQYGISMRALRLANNMNDGNVKVGSVLTIPSSS